MLKNVSKHKKIMKTEKTIKKLVDGITVHCSNPDCKAKVKLKADEIDRAFSCTTCNKGRFTKIIEPKIEKKQKKSGPVIKMKAKKE